MLAGASSLKIELKRLRWNGQIVTLKRARRGERQQAYARHHNELTQPLRSTPCGCANIRKQRGDRSIFFCRHAATVCSYYQQGTHRHWSTKAWSGRSLMPLSGTYSAAAGSGSAAAIATSAVEGRYMTTVAALCSCKTKSRAARSTLAFLFSALISFAS